ncbi:PepSY domain-containing protein [Planobispora longispora]|uniref:PepSY domain-containing protein n=1 Tax=Planobispora longispora TaxID=28887 RepID=A0A8J3RPM2_9ACTN|nr:PepSY domain-containing protein [Planobispora longispora]GIH77607.1 hypothetical protein Plo01_40360 [Planobispora longispora]
MRPIDAITGTVLAAGTAALLLAGGGAVQATTGTAAARAASPTTAPSTAPTAAPTSAPAEEITSEKAVEIARHHAPGAEVVGVERVHEQGIWTWWVRMEEGVWRYDLYISTKSGRVVRLKINYNW